MLAIILSSDIQNWFKQYPLFYENLKFAGVLLLAIVVYLGTKKIVIRALASIIHRSKSEIDDLILNQKLLRRISYIAPLLVLHEFTYLIPSAQSFLENIIEALVVLVILLIVGTIVTSINDIFEKSEKFKDKPVKGYLQVVKIVIYILGGIFIIGLLTDQSPWTIITGVGALTAIIILIFKDTILSFVASIQISSYDLVRKGDWIEMPKYGADGDVIDISLNVIKIQNFDKTIVVVPTYKLVEESFKNWRGMQLTGGRRIKRAVHIDLSSVKFCDNEMLQKFRSISLLKDYIDKKVEELKEYNQKYDIDFDNPVNGRRLTNLGTFRAYLAAYLKNRDDINSNLTFLIRQLEPGPNGLPIEIYVFANTVAWGEYEDIQSDIFDHIFAVVPQFDLRIYQNPAGGDFQSLLQREG